MTYREFMMMPLGVQLDYLYEEHILEEEAVQQFRYFAHVFDIKHGMVVHNQFAKSFIDMQIRPYKLPIANPYIIYPNPYIIYQGPFAISTTNHLARVVELIVGKEAFYLYFAKEVNNASDLARDTSRAIGHDKNCTKNKIEAIKAIFDKYPEAMINQKSDTTTNT